MLFRSPEVGELDIDFVDHGVEGPASAWAYHAAVGDKLQIAIPNAAYAGKPIGFEWRPPRDVSRLLIMGDETRSEERRVGKECRSRWSPYH